MSDILIGWLGGLLLGIIIGMIVEGWREGRSRRLAEKAQRVLLEKAREPMTPKAQG